MRNHLTKHHFTAEQLKETLKNITVGETACNYSFKKCSELNPLVNETTGLIAVQSATTVST